MSELSDKIEEVLKTPEAKLERAKIDFVENLIQIMNDHGLCLYDVARMLPCDIRLLNKFFK